MEIARRFLVLSPVALGVGAATFLTFYVVADVGMIEIGLAAVVALVAAAVATVVVLAVVLVTDSLLSLLDVRNAWTALGLAFGVVAVVLGIVYAGIAASRSPSNPGLDLIVIMQVPAWLTFAVGLLVGDLWNRAARDRTVSPSVR